MLQPGNRLSLRWRARLDDQLGHIAAEPARARHAVLADDTAGCVSNRLHPELLHDLLLRDGAHRFLSGDRVVKSHDWAVYTMNE